MTNIEDTGHQLAELIKKYDADYIEARLEESQSNHITYRGKNLESVNKNTATGGNVRALVRGGWGFVSFNSLDELPDRVESAIKQAKAVGNEESQLAEVEPAVETVPALINNDPMAMPLAEKKQLLDEYNEIIWSTPGIQGARYIRKVRLRARELWRTPATRARRNGQTEDREQDRCLHGSTPPRDVADKAELAACSTSSAAASEGWYSSLILFP